MDNKEITFNRFIYCLQMLLTFIKVITHLQGFKKKMCLKISHSITIRHLYIAYKCHSVAQ